MSGEAVTIDEGTRAWDTLGVVAEAIGTSNWVLVGGLMVQLHALRAGVRTRVTKDVDILVDLMAGRASVSTLVARLEAAGFTVREPGLRGAAFHRMIRDDFVVDILIADHLPSKKQASAKLRRWPLLQTVGGAQAIERKELVPVQIGSQSFEIYVPNLLGALVLKCAAYEADRRDRNRHLGDVTLLASLISNPRSVKEQMKGSDKKRIANAYQIMRDLNHPMWLMLEVEDCARAQENLRILAG